MQKELTQDEITMLVMYLLMGTKTRREELEMWKQLAQERTENGKSIYKNAASNAAWCQELETHLNSIIEKLT